MMLACRLRSNEKGVAAIETAFALPILVVLLWMMVQIAQVYRAMAGMQQALGEGARYATLCLSPTSTGCTSPTIVQVKARINSSVAGTGTGTFTVDDPVPGSDGTGNFYDLKVNYSQPTDMLLFPGPTVSLSRSKRVWISS